MSDTAFEVDITPYASGVSVMRFLTRTDFPITDHTDYVGSYACNRALEVNVNAVRIYGSLRDLCADIANKCFQITGYRITSVKKISYNGAQGVCKNGCPLFLLLHCCRVDRSSLRCIIVSYFFLVISLRNLSEPWNEKQ